MDARERLLRRVMEHVANHGLGDTSLRDIADAVGTSHRMLNYHFGGRDGLVAAIVTAMESDQRMILRDIASTATSPADAVLAQWEVLTSEDALPFVRLFFEVLALAAHGRPGTEGFLESLTQPWIELGRTLGDMLGTAFDDVDLRLGIAVVRGLLLDVIASGDARPARDSLRRFLDTASL